MRLITLILYCQVAFSLFGVEDQTLLTRKHTNAVRLVEGPNDANIAKLTARILQSQHYLKPPLNDEVSSKFLDRYLDALDNFHMYFLQSDLNEFESYRTNLDDLTYKSGDMSPARVIFLRFIERLEQQYAYVAELLKTETFEFNGDDRYGLNRKTLPRPVDPAEAKKLWRDRLRYEYLQEKLNVGKPEVIAQLILDKLNQRKPKEVEEAIQQKLSKEKAQQIVKIIEEKWGKNTPDEIVKSILAKLDQDNAEEIVKIITRRYTRVLKALRDYDNDDVVQIYLRALTNVCDPHSDYLGKAESDNFAISMKLSLFGIGALLRSEDGYCKIQELKPGPALESKKIKPNDKIIAVAQGAQEPVDVVEMPLRKVVELIRGPKGTEVRLTIIPADAPDPSVRETVSLIRDKIKLEDQEGKAKIIELPAANHQVARLGIIDLPSFYSEFELKGRQSGEEPKSTTTDVTRLLKKLIQEKVSGVILDLRHNGGGSLEEAIKLTGLFIKQGPVVQVKEPDGDPKVDYDPDPSVVYDGPLVVLTSRFSASASEILAGALQDYGRALVVGDSSTHGKGTVQSLIYLDEILRRSGLTPTADPGALKITIRKFYRASGASTQKRGVIPDLVLPSVNNELEVGEAFLDYALDYDSIPSAKFEKLTRVEPFLAELKKRSDGRLAKDNDFAFIREEIERYKKAAAEKSVSLNEAQRLKEKKEADERSKARKKELASRPEPPGKIYEITLKQVELPGLPPPVARTNMVKQADATRPSEHPQVAENKKPSPSSPRTEEDSDDLDENLPNVDPTLEETKRILLDLISLSGKQNSLAATLSEKTK